MVALIGFSDSTGHSRFELDLLSGKFTKTMHATYEECSKDARGFGAIRKVGIRKRHEVFVAMYSLGDLLHVDIPPQRFTWPGPYAAKREAAFAITKSFSISAGTREVLRFDYLFVDALHEFPAPEIVDIFYYIANETAANKNIRRFIYYWEAHGNGVNTLTDEFFRDLAERQKSW